MKKVITGICMLFLSAAIFTGCGTKENTASQNGTNNQKTEQSEIEQFAEPKKEDTIAEITVKDFGTMKFKFFEKEAPKAVENFITHAKEGYYDGLIFHRVINDFMIQGGDPTGTGMGGESIWGDNFEDEFSDNLQPYRGALCMANAGENTNGSQFFIVQANPVSKEMLENIEKENNITLPTDPAELLKALYGAEVDKEAAKIYIEKGGTPWLFQKHTVFGQLIEGEDILDKIAAVQVGDADKPVKDVIIEKITITNY